MATLAEFDLLHHSCTDIQSLKWTQFIAREAMNLHFGIRRAREEITHLNVELHHLITYMTDRTALWQMTIQESKTANPPLAVYLSQLAAYNTLVFDQVCYHLRKTSQLHGFSGTLQPGQQIGRPGTRLESVRMVGWYSTLMGNYSATAKGTEDGMREEARDPVEDIQNNLMIDLMENLSTAE
jgi:hypothetical protein